MYIVEILVNNDSEYNAHFEFDDFEECVMFLKIVTEQGYEAKVTKDWENENA